MEIAVRIQDYAQSRADDNAPRGLTHPAGKRMARLVQGTPCDRPFSRAHAHP
jgi:hypothetical protein